MTIDDLRLELTRLSAEGKGHAKVIWQGISHTYDVELELTTREGKPVLLVNR